MKTTRPSKNSGSSQARQLIHFEYEDMAACRVCLAGTFNDWHPTVSEMISMGSGRWVKDLELLPGAYEYRLVVDGQWVNDPHCARTVPNAFGGTNSLLTVPEP